MILLIGATGAAGTHLTQLLASRGDVRALAHSDRSADALGAAGVEVVRGDLADPSTLGPAFAGVERLFLLTPYTPDQLAHETAALDAAAAAGVGRVVKLAAVVGKLAPHLAATQAHLAVAERLRAPGSPAATILWPDYFASNLLGQAEALRAGRLVVPVGDGRVTVIDPRDIAEVAAVALTAEDPIEGDLHLMGPAPVTFAQIAQELSAGLGREVVHADVPAPAWHDAATGAGLPAFYADALVEMFDAMRGFAPGDFPASDVERVLGRPPRPLADYAREVLAPALEALEPARA